MLPRKIEIGLDVNVLSGEMPSLSAVASTNGLKEEPGWRSPCTARLNWLSWKLRPPYITSTAPVEGLIATSAACGPVRARKPLVDRRARELLEPEVDRRRDPEPAAEDALRPELVDQLLLDEFAEVRRLPPHAREMDVLRLRQRRSNGATKARGLDDPLLEHQPQHDSPPLDRRPRMGNGVVAARVLRNAGEQRGLRQGQLQRVVSEICSGRTLDAVGAVPEIDRVEVGGEDLVLAPVLLELPRERGLLQLAGDRALRAGQLVLHELLRDRRASLHGGLLPDVGPEGARHAADVDPAVLVEAAVLGRDDRLLDPRRDLAALHEYAALAAAEDGEDRVTVARVDVPVDLLPRRLCEGVEPAQLLTDRHDEAVGERRQREDTENAEKGEEAKLADPAPWPARSRRLGAFSAKRHGRGGC